MDAPAATGTLLWSRAAVLSAVALLTGAAAHVQADGLLPGPAVLVALVGAGALVCAPLLRRPGSVWRITALLVAGQAAVHLVLSAAAGHRGEHQSATPAPAVPTPTSTGSRSGSYYDVAYASQVGQPDAGLSLPAPLLHAFTDVAAHPAMAFTHLLAAALCGWWLAMGERALWTLLSLASRAWAEHVATAARRWVASARAVVVTSLHVELPVLAVAVALPLPQSQVRSRGVSRRGPPLLE